MKTLKKIAAVALSGVLLAMTGSLAAFAADERNTVDFAGEAGDGKYWSYIGVETYGDLNDLFGEVTKNLVPGDEKTVTVQLRNAGDAETTFYLKAERLTRDDAEAIKEKSPEKYEALIENIEAVENAFSDKKAVDDLLARIGIEVKYGNATIYEGTLGGAGAGDLYSEAGAALGALAAKNYGVITATLRVPADLDNSHVNGFCAVNWLFTATQEDPESGEPDPEPGDPDPGPDGGATIPDGETPLDDGPLTEIEDEGTPLDGLPEDTDLVVIADPETPLALPQTGGLLTYATPAALALAALIALYAATYIKGRKRANKGMPE